LNCNRDPTVLDYNFIVRSNRINLARLDGFSMTFSPSW
jgi:hypothetical protein